MPSKRRRRPPGKVVGAQISQHPDWFKESFLEIAEDVAEAAEADKHVLLFFHLSGCPYCYKMVEENFKHSDYTEFLQEHFDVIAINIRGDREVIFNEEVSLTEKELARHLKVRYTPTVLFLDGDNRPVLRLNGYRSVADFKTRAGFPSTAKLTGGQTYPTLSKRESTAPSTPCAITPNFTAADDLSALEGKPLLVLFEDRTCTACDALHDGVLALPETRAIMDRFTAVRLDALSERSIIDPTGNRPLRRTSPPRSVSATDRA